VIGELHAGEGSEDSGEAEGLLGDTVTL